MNPPHRSSWRWLLSSIIILGSPSLVLAHTGMGGISGLCSGLTHPFGGLDHLCAMLGVGMWAAQRGRHAVWLVPIAFMVVMALGGLLGMLAVSMPFVERGIVASVLILGVLIAIAARLPLVLSVLVVGTFALFHGHAHGAEMPHTASGLMYGIGFLTATAVLHLSGVGLGLIARQTRSVWLLRYAGAAILLCGVYLCLGH